MKHIKKTKTETTVFPKLNQHCALQASDGAWQLSRCAAAAADWAAQRSAPTDRWA